MTPTNGRLDAHLAAITWPWIPGMQRTRAIEPRIPKGMTPRWYTLCPDGMERPDWVPAEALVFALPNSDDHGYVW